MNRILLFVILGYLHAHSLINSSPLHHSTLVKENASKSFAIDYDNGQFLLDGQPFRYISGSFHYFRVHPDQWVDRLKRIRAVGFNAIQTYIPWNFHEVEKGQFDFSGGRDFARFVKIAESLGMYTLLRMGPYSCAEWENGGLPYWLIVDTPDIRQRTNDSRFTAEVFRWFTVLSTQIRPLLRHNGGPVLMVQVENEYGMFTTCDRNYTTWLRDVAWSLLGRETVLYTADGASEENLQCGATEGVLPTLNFGPSSKDRIISNFELLKKHLRGGKGPLVDSEFYDGWFTMWGQKSQGLPSTDAIIESAKIMFELGANINFYLIHGGTNFGFWNGAEDVAPVITSYDFFNPISEGGDYKDKYWKIRSWIKSIEGWPNPPLTPPDAPLTKAYSDATLKLLAPLSGAIIEDSCVDSEDPLSFEALRQQFGYVVYYKKLDRCGKNLTIENINDFGYVNVGGIRMKEWFVKRFYDLKVHSISIENCTVGDDLEILVENQGRLTFGTINDFKGILSPVLLDGERLKGWTQCRVGGPFEVQKKALFNVQNPNNERAAKPGSPGIYIGTFNVDVVADTWLKMKDWGKGHVVVNGHNIGRHWSTQGPQYNLYVPAPFLVKGRNLLEVLEIQGANKNDCNDSNCIIPFSDKPDIHFQNQSYYNVHKIRPKFSI